MMPCNPATTFCSIVGHARRHTAEPIGPSTMDRSNFCAGVPWTRGRAASAVTLMRDLSGLDSFGFQGTLRLLQIRHLPVSHHSKTCSDKGQGSSAPFLAQG